MNFSLKALIIYICGIIFLKQFNTMIYFKILKIIVFPHIFEKRAIILFHVHFLNIIFFLYFSPK